VYDHVIWPEQYDPRHSAIYALNDIDVKAPPEVVWKLLQRMASHASARNIYYFCESDQPGRGSGH
jgi:hypothetical protein